MTETEMNEFIKYMLEEAPLPDWAYGRTPKNNPWVKHAQLSTKDGRRMGNGRITDCLTDVPYGPLYVVITDAGNVLRLTLNELMECFHAPKYLTESTPLEEVQHELAELHNIYKLYPGAWCCNAARNSNGWNHLEDCKNYVLCY